METPLWPKIKALTDEVYRQTAKMPKSELNNFISQMHRAVDSIGSNFSEGYGRLTKDDFRHFMAMARGSANEVAGQADICGDLGFIAEPAKIIDLAYDVACGLTRLIKSAS